MNTPMRIAEGIVNVVALGAIVVVAVLATLLFFSMVDRVTAAELTLAERYTVLDETGRIDHSADGLVAVEAAQATLGALHQLKEADRVEVEQVADTALLVRMPLKDNGAIWHLVVFAKNDAGVKKALIHVIGHELPVQPATIPFEPTFLAWRITS